LVAASEAGASPRIVGYAAKVTVCLQEVSSDLFFSDLSFFYFFSFLFCFFSFVDVLERIEWLPKILAKSRFRT